MATYISSKGEELDTKNMDKNHLRRALAKAIREDNKANIDACAEELLLRESNQAKI